MFRKEHLMKILRQTGVPVITRWFNRHNIVVLMYHGVTPDDCEVTEDNTLHVRESDFFEQMAYLRKHYNVVHLNEALMDNHKKFKLALTFDDGYANLFSTAYPILKRFDLPATIFLVTEYVDRNKLFWYDKIFINQRLNGLNGKEIIDLIDRYKNIHSHSIDQVIDEEYSGRIPKEGFEAYRILNFNEIKKMSQDSLINFGSHTERHELLTTLNTTEAFNTLKQSFEKIQTLNNGIRTFCYPNGFYNKEHVDLCRSIGYDQAVTIKSGFWIPDKTPIFEIPRFNIPRHMKLNEFVSKISGFINIIKSLLNV